MLNVVSQLLTKRYMTTIREEEGRSYGVSVNPSALKLPSPKFSLSINFDCDPEKRDRLMEIVVEEITRIKNEACDAKDLKEIKNNFIKSRQEAELQNSFWLGVLLENQMVGSKFTSKEEYKILLNSIDADFVKKFAKKLFKKVNTVEVIMNPKK
ncbi:hypothetical protein DWB61_12750 [Ancylomarina euxinus]|uniref:Peptidase M16 C-terminal domain-containing protein n=1 Tax=Ancylomarina euxinus TaxID=2283627 RepID=A0A425XZ04_9BACT|nr:insulinase family protein [Ancylomarina euxinus]MCZ4695586.1 insulinase family protein [Ancylomarina euxinus]MUP15967.1 hypothetical protein [Ancylomarina euxinus]RRG20409.1 hypothetical protein DWB61_12750 [Ancylomarina euxinus]